MKKMLLSVVAALTITASAFAATVGDNYQRVESTADLTIGAEYILCSGTVAMGDYNGSKYYKPVSNAITISDDGKIATIDNAGSTAMSFNLVEGSAENTYAIKYVENGTAYYLTCTGTSNGSLNRSNSLVETANLNITIQADFTAKIIPVKNSNTNKNVIQYNKTSGQERFTNYKTGGQQLVTLYKKVTDPIDETKVATPLITPTSGAVEAGTKVTISCSDSEAEIHYTTNGDDPTAESAIYTAETDITVNEAMTVKAIAVKEGLENSKIATAEYTIKKTTAANIAEFISLIKTNPNEVFSIQTPVTAVYQKNLTTNNQNLYVTDGTDWLLVYGNVGKTYNNGDVIAAGIKGTAYDYSGTYELSNPDASTFADGVAGTPVEPAEVTSISADIVNHYVVVKGVTIGTPSSDNATATMADGTEIALYNKFQLNNFEAGSNLTVKGFVNVRNNTTIQLLPIEITNAAGEEIVAAPTFDPAPGAVIKGTVVTISCATEGATIYYYLNGEDKGAYSGEAIEINEDTKIEAYAVKEGMSNSEVVEAQYTIKAEIPEANKASFDFTKMGLYDKDGNLLSTPATSKDVSLVSTILTDNHVFISFDKGTHNTDPRLYNSKGDIDLRLYKGQSMTIEATGGLKIESIELAGTTVDVLGTTTGTYTAEKSSGTWTPAATRASSVEKVTFSVTGSARINTINVVTSGVYDSVDDIIVDENAPVEYYNLQGVRVANPENGIYIRRQGSKVSKVLVK